MGTRKCFISQTEFFPPDFSLKTILVFYVSCVAKFELKTRTNAVRSLEASKSQKRGRKKPETFSTLPPSHLSCLFSSPPLLHSGHYLFRISEGAKSESGRERSLSYRPTRLGNLLSPPAAAVFPRTQIPELERARRTATTLASVSQTRRMNFPMRFYALL